MKIHYLLKSIGCAVLAALVIGASCGCERSAEEATVSSDVVSETTSAMPSETADKPTYARRRIIIDTDAGADDAAAIILAAKIPNVEILGVTGTMSGEEGIVAQSVSVTPTSSIQTVVPDSSQGYNYISQVTVAAIPYVETSNAYGLTATIG